MGLYCSKRSYSAVDHRKIAMEVIADDAEFWKGLLDHDVGWCVVVGVCMERFWGLEIKLRAVQSGSCCGS